MGRPILLGSRPRGPEHREFNELPALGTAPETQQPCTNLEAIFRPRSVFRRLAHSFIRRPSWDKQTRQRQTYSIAYTYRKHKAQRRRHRPNTVTRQSGFRGPPRGGGRTQAPTPWSKNRCDSFTWVRKSVAIAKQNRDTWCTQRLTLEILFPYHAFRNYTEII